MHLMVRINKYYLLEKISSRSVFLLNESKKQTIKTIEDNGWDCYGIESVEDWEELKKDILDIDSCASEETFFRMIDDIMPDIDWESIITEKDYPYGAKVIADMFEKYVQPQIKEDMVR